MIKTSKDWIKKKKKKLNRADPLEKMEKVLQIFLALKWRGGSRKELKYKHRNLVNVDRPEF